MKEQPPPVLFNFDGAPYDCPPGYLPIRLDFSESGRIVALSEKIRQCTVAEKIRPFGATRSFVVGALLKLCMRAAAETGIAWLPGWDRQTVDEEAGLDGFCAAAQAVGVLRVDSGGLHIDHFESVIAWPPLTQAAINIARAIVEHPGLSKDELARKAGYNEGHARRIFREHLTGRGFVSRHKGGYWPPDGAY